MTITDREKFLLWVLLEFQIMRYLMSINRFEGSERAQRHVTISKIITQFIQLDENPTHEDIMSVHDYLSIVLTDHLDFMIGFPIDRSVIGQEYDSFATKFFNVIVDNLKEIENVLYNNK